MVCTAYVCFFGRGEVNRRESEGAERTAGRQRRQSQCIGCGGVAREGRAAGDSAAAARARRERVVPALPTRWQAECAGRSTVAAT